MIKIKSCYKITAFFLDGLVVFVFTQLSHYHYKHHCKLLTNVWLCRNPHLNHIDNLGTPSKVVHY